AKEPLLVTQRPQVSRTRDRFGAPAVRQDSSTLPPSHDEAAWKPCNVELRFATVSSPLSQEVHTVSTAIAPTRMRLVILPVRVVPEYRRLIVFRLGRMSGVKGPGLIWVIPFFDRVMSVDLRESFLEIPHQTSITKDNAPISIDFITFFKVIDPEASVVQVA